MPQMLHRLVANRDKDRVIRKETLHGRPHTVVPMISMGEGVLNGSGGPGYYPGANIQNSTTLWDHKPLVVYHPKSRSNIPISACSPSVLDTQQVGVVLNTQYDGKLRHEAWIDDELADKVDDRVLKAVNNNEMMEVSTGLYTTDNTKKGVYNGVPYDWVAEDFKPDHIALLPDQIGAYSIKNGGGLLRVNSEYVEVANTSDISAIVQAEVERQMKLNKGKDMSFERSKHIDALIANGVFPETQRKDLELVPDTILQTFKAEKPKENAVVPPVVPPVVNPVIPAPVVNATPPITWDALKGLMSPQEQYIFNQMKTNFESRKEELIRIITTNANNKFTPEFLATVTDLQMLEGMAALSGSTQQAAPSMFYGGQQGVTTNAAAPKKAPEAMKRPSLDFSTN